MYWIGDGRQGAWDGLSKPREAGSSRRVLGSRVTLWGALQQLDLRTQPVQEGFEQKLFEVSHIGRVCEGRGSTIIHWSLRFGIQSKQNSLRWMYEPNIESTKHVLVAFGAESKPALNRLHSTILLSINANFCILCSFRVKLEKT